MLRWYKRNRYMIVGSFLGFVIWNLIGLGLIGIVLVIVLGILGQRLDRARSGD